MKRIFITALRLPAWFFVIAAVACLGLGFKAVSLMKDHNAQLVYQAATTPPSVVDYQHDMPGLSGEIALRAKVDEEIYANQYFNVDGAEDDVEYYFFLREIGGVNSGRDLSAVIIFETNQRALMEQWFDRVTLVGASSPNVLEFRGIAADTDARKAKVSNILEQYEAQPSDNFVFIRPFLEGRDAYFQNKAFDILRIQLIMWTSFGALMVWALIRHSIRNFVRSAQSDAPNSTQTATDAGRLRDAAGDRNDIETRSGISKIVFALISGRKETAPQEAAFHDSTQPRHGPRRIEEMPVYTPPRQLFFENEDDWPDMPLRD